MSYLDTTSRARFLPFGSQRLLRLFRRCAIGTSIGVAAMGGASTAIAGTGGNSLQFDVVPLPAAVSYATSSLSQPTFAAYKVTITSIGSSGASNIWFKAKAATANFAQATSGFGCVQDTTDSTLVICKLGSIDPAPAIRQFVLVYSVNPLDTNNPLPSCVEVITNNCIRLSYFIASGQGTADNQPSDSQFSQVGSAETVVSAAVANTNTSNVQSYLVLGGTAGTAAGTLSSELSNSDAKTTVTVPKESPVSIEQKETSNQGSCQSIYKKCFRTELKIQDGGLPIQFGSTQAAALKLTLYRDLATVKGNQVIGNAILQYSETGNPGTFTDIQACAVDSTFQPFLLAGQKNCIVNRALEGNKWRFNLLASQNGLRIF